VETHKYIAEFQQPYHKPVFYNIAFIFLKCTISKNTMEVLLLEMRAKHMLISYMQAS
jgi:hypothetical protein